MPRKAKRSVDIVLCVIYEKYAQFVDVIYHEKEKPINSSK